ncbi:MAG: hypothetical protein M3Y81_25470 [Chloroflexota bacterium]|nr:hypothetical protein [Chloroflexota bacterium]
MYGINDLMYVFYWRNSKDDEWSISQPVTLGEIIDNVEFEFQDGGTLPINDVNWGNDEIKVVPVPTRRYAPTEIPHPKPESK